VRIEDRAEVEGLAGGQVKCGHDPSNERN